MATQTISNALIAKLAPQPRHYDVRDNKLKGFLIRVNPSGSMSYVVQYARGKRLHIGKVGVLTPAQARERASRFWRNTRLALILSGRSWKNAP